MGSTSRGSQFPEPRVRGDSPAEQKGVYPILATSQHGLGRDDVRDGFLERRGDVGDRKPPPVGFYSFDNACHRRFQTGKRKIITVATRFVGSAHVFRRGQTPGESERLRVSPRCRVINCGSARIRETKDSCDLVVCLPCRIIQSCPKQRDVSGDIGDLENLGVTARNQQCAQTGWKLPRDVEPMTFDSAVLEKSDTHMSDKMVDRVERLTRGDGERFCGADPDHEGPGQSRSAGHGDGVDVLESDPGIMESGLEGGSHGLKMSARCDFRNNAAEANVLFHR